MLTNVPRIGDVEVMARLLLDVGAEVDGIGTDHAADSHANVLNRFARSRAGGQAAGIRAPARSAAGAYGGARTSLRRAVTFRRGGPSPRTRGAAGDGRARREGARPRARGAEWPEGRLDVSLRSIGHRHRDGAPRRGVGHRASPRSDTPPPSLTSSSCASSSPRWAPASPASAARRSGSRVYQNFVGAQHRLGGDYIEAGSWAVVAAITGGEIAIEGVARKTSRSSPR